MAGPLASCSIIYIKLLASAADDAQKTVTCEYNAHSKSIVNILPLMKRLRFSACVSKSSELGAGVVRTSEDVRGNLSLKAGKYSAKRSTAGYISSAMNRRSAMAMAGSVTRTVLSVMMTLAQGLNLRSSLSTNFRSSLHLLSFLRSSLDEDGVPIRLGGIRVRPTSWMKRCGRTCELHLSSRNQAVNLLMSVPNLNLFLKYQCSINS